jgi:protein ImuB
MSGTLYACAYAAEFPAQALLRLRPDLASQPVVVLEGQPPKETVCALNRQARLRGAAAGMTRLEIENLATGNPGGFALLPRSVASEAAARAVFLECAAQFSPRIEEVSREEVSWQASRKTNMGAACAPGTACSFILDIAGTERLFGPPGRLAARLRAALGGAGFRASVAVSANYHAARMKAAAGRGPHRQVLVDGMETRGIAVIPAGAEAAALGKLPIVALELDQDQEETFALWGIRTLGELACMPETELVTRLGAMARTWRALARGEAEHTFAPIEPKLALEEFCEFENPVEQIDSLLFVGARMIDCLAARAEARALALAALTVELKLEGGRVHQRVLRPALPSTDRKFLLKLLQLEIGAHPPPAAVVALTLAAQAGRSGKVQLGLFVPQMPEPSRLDVTLARLKAMVGEERVGAPALEDTHRSGSFRMESFAALLPTPAPKSPHGRRPVCPPQEAKITSWGPGRGDPENGARMGHPARGVRRSPFPSSIALEAQPARMALRRVRPPTPVRVEFFPTLSPKNGERMGRPVMFCDAENRFEVAAAYGPWRSSGCWWSGEGWDDEEWDVLARGGEGVLIACLLVCDRTRKAWRLEAFYD